MTELAVESPDRLRVLHVDDGPQWRGGQHQVWLLVTELARLGVAQRLVTRPGSPLAARAREAGIETVEADLGNEWLPSGGWRLARLAAEWGAVLLHAHTAHAHTHALRAVRRLGGAVRLVVSRRVDFPVARHGWSARKYGDPRTHYLAISSAVREVLVAGGVAPERIQIVPSGVPPLPLDACWTRERVRRELGIGPTELAIVNVGALTDHKGQRYLIEAAPAVLEAFPAASVHVLGEGELRGALERRIQRLGLVGRVVLHGFVPDARLKLAGFDLYVQPSHLEGLGTAILDAMLAGVPVVAAAAGGIPDVVEEGATGRLCPPRDPAALAARIVEALRETVTSQQMARAARDRVQARFSARAMAEATLAAYRRLLASPEPPVRQGATT